MDGDDDFDVPVDPVVETHIQPVTHASYLVERIRIMETRRNYFGNIFWRMPGFTIALVVLFVGVAHQGNRGIDWWAFVAAGVALMLLGYIAWRLKEAQDEAEADLARLEEELTAVCNFVLSHPLRPSRKYGARFRLVLVFWISGALGIATGLFLAA